MKKHFQKGETFVVTFPFTDLSSYKLRPAVVLADVGNDVTFCFVGSGTENLSPFDFVVAPTLQNGFTVKSAVRTGKIATISKSLIRAEMGALSLSDLHKLDLSLKLLFKLD
jgi:mRNA interferase MazF